MGQSISDRHKIENEAVFRERNEKIKSRMDSHNVLARESNQHDLVDSEDMVLQFLCECSDENCTTRVSMRSEEYHKIHLDRHNFVVASGHETLEIEVIIKTLPGYTIVAKYIEPSSKNPKLRHTDIENSPST